MDRLKILFAMHFEVGHIVSSFSFAKSLQIRGHEVIYLSIPDYKELIERQGFVFMPFAEDIMPLDFEKNLKQNESKHAKKIFSIYKKYKKKLTDGTLDRWLDDVKADILICDPFLSYIAIRALHKKIPSITLFTSLFFHENNEIPPVVLYQYPCSKLKTVMLWKRMFLKFIFTKKINNIITRKFCSPTKMHHIVKDYLEVAKKTGYPCKKDKTYRLNEIGFNLMLPEIALCTKSFQYPKTTNTERLYLGNFVDIERNEEQSDLDTGNRPLIYCSLGTAAATYTHAHRFYESVVKTSAMKNNWFFILQISDNEAIRKYKSTENLHISKWVPQVRILEKAALMVTHGGLNSIMECVCLEVPMVIIPGMRDQPGNAARASFHGIALTAKMKTLDAEKLLRLIENTLKNGEIKKNIAKMKENIEKEDGMNKSITFIEQYAKKICSTNAQSN